MRFGVGKYYKEVMKSIFILISLLLLVYIFYPRCVYIDSNKNYNKVRLEINGVDNSGFMYNRDYTINNTNEINELIEILNKYYGRIKVFHSTLKYNGETTYLFFNADTSYIHLEILGDKYIRYKEYDVNNNYKEIKSVVLRIYGNGINLDNVLDD